jgi:hypothetical protein
VSADQVLQMQQAGLRAYQAHFSGMKANAQTIIDVLSARSNGHSS